jgi:tetratricopeptide (TPR) repeat protein
MGINTTFLRCDLAKQQSPFCRGGMCVYGLVFIGIIFSDASVSEARWRRHRICRNAVNCTGAAKSAAARAASQCSSPDSETILGVSDLRAEVAQYNLQLQRSPNNVTVRIARGMALLELGEIAAGNKDLALAVKLAPTSAHAWEAFGDGQLDSGNYQSALTAFSKAINLGLGIARVFMKRGNMNHCLKHEEAAIQDLTYAIRLEPSNADAYFYRAEVWRALDQWEKAFTDLNRLVELKPISWSYGTRAIAYFDRKEYEKGIEDVWQAIRRNPGDVGVHYKPTNGRDLSPEELKHGEEQVRKMLADRPAMAEHVTAGDQLWTWAARKFAGEDVGIPVDWDDTQPSKSLALSAANSSLAYLQISSTRNDLPENPPCTSDDLWRFAVFELNNLIATKEFEQIDEQAASGKLTRDEYIYAKIRTEDSAMQLTRAFYLKTYLPWLRSKNILQTSPHEWFCDGFFSGDDPQQEIAMWRQQPHWSHYSAYYDLIQVGRFFESKDYAIASEILRSLLASERSLTNQQAAEAHHWTGDLHWINGDLKRAIEEYEKALMLFPSQQISLRARDAALQNSRANAIDER